MAWSPLPRPQLGGGRRRRRCRRGCLGPHHQDAIARPRRRPLLEPFQGNQANAHGVDQGVLVIATVKIDFSAHGGDAQAFAIVGNAADSPLEEPSAALQAQVPEAQGIEDGHRPRPHGKDIANNPPHSGGGAVVGLHRRGVVVALNLKGNSQPFAGADYPGILPGALNHLGPLGGQSLEQVAGMLITTVLRPHDADEGQLQLIGAPAQLV